MPQRLVRLPGFSDREAEMADRLREMEAIVQPTDWFLRSSIQDLRDELLKRWTARVTEQHQRYADWKRQFIQQGDFK
jgi:hypothetical protein